MWFNSAMDTQTAIEKAGGFSTVSVACTNRGLKVSPQGVAKWSKQNRLPWSEYAGTTQYAQIISDLALANGHAIYPSDICPGAGQYQEQPKEKVA